MSIFFSDARRHGKTTDCVPKLPNNMSVEHVQSNAIKEQAMSAVGSIADLLHCCAQLLNQQRLESLQEARVIACLDALDWNS